MDVPNPPTGLPVQVLYRTKRFRTNPELFEEALTFARSQFCLTYFWAIFQLLWVADRLNRKELGEHYRLPRRRERPYVACRVYGAVRRNRLTLDWLLDDRRRTSLDMFCWFFHYTAQAGRLAKRLHEGEAVADLEDYENFFIRCILDILENLRGDLIDADEVIPHLQATPPLLGPRRRSRL